MKQLRLFFFFQFRLTSVHCRQHPDSHADSTSSGSRRSALRCSPPLGPATKTQWAQPGGRRRTHRRFKRVIKVAVDVPRCPSGSQRGRCAASCCRPRPERSRTESGEGETFTFSTDKETHTQPCTRRTDAVDVHSPGRPGRSGTV